MEFNLSEKLWIYANGSSIINGHDVIEFIEKLKKELCKEMYDRPTATNSSLDHISQITIKETIDKLAGDKLITNRKEVSEIIWILK